MAEPLPPPKPRRGRRTFVSLALLAVVLGLTVVQLGPSTLGSVDWMASVLPQQQQQNGQPCRAGLLVPAPPRHADTSALPAAVAAQSLPQGIDDSYVAFCIIVKDEHCDIREWVLHHASIGVGKFYLFDTQSTPPMAPVLDDLIESGLVRYQYLTNDTTEIALETPRPGRSYNWQRPVYQLCLERFGPRHTWMGFFDADEFVVMQGATAEDPGSLPDLLQRFEVYSGLVLHWRFFGFGGHVLRPPGGVLASYTACNPRVSALVKSIVQPGWVRTLQTVHTFAFRNKTYAVNTRGVRVWKPALPSGKESDEGAVLHHYISRSLADFEVKTRRRGGAGSVKTLENFIHYHRTAKGVCTVAVPLGQALAARYDLSRHVPPRCLDTERRRRLALRKRKRRRRRRAT